MYKLWLVFAFVLLSHKAQGFKIKRQWGDSGGDFVNRPQESNEPTNKPQATSQKPTSNSNSYWDNIIQQDCLLSCPVTAEYNPVCGTNNVTYDNPGRLICAQACGINVTQRNVSRCPFEPTPPVA